MNAVSLLFSWVLKGDLGEKLLDSFSQSGGNILGANNRTPLFVSSGRGELINQSSQ